MENLTREQALENLEILIDEWEKEGIMDPEIIESVRMAKDSMKKDIPLKPDMRHLKAYDGYNDGWCPECKSYVQEIEYDTERCQKCGQALDWPK